MSAVSAWLMSILGIVVIGTLIDLVIPSGRMSKFLKSVFSALTVLIIVLPIPGFIKNGFSFNSSQLILVEFTLDNSYIEKADAIKFKYLSKGVEKQLESEGVSGAVVEIKGSFDGTEPKITSVLINIENLVLDSAKQHINKNEYVADAVASYLGIGRGIITVYG